MALSVMNLLLFVRRRVARVRPGTGTLEIIIKVLAD